MVAQAVDKMVFGEMVTVIESSHNLTGNIHGPFFPDSRLKAKKKDIFSTIKQHKILHLNYVAKTTTTFSTFSFFVLFVLK